MDTQTQLWLLRRNIPRKQSSNMGRTANWPCVRHTPWRTQHTTIRSHGQMTYSPHNDDKDDASVDGLVNSVDTLPYNFDVCQLTLTAVEAHHSQIKLGITTFNTK